jgi:HlyD family secretion protein
MTRKKVLIAVVVLVVIAAVVYANVAFRRSDAVSVTVEAVSKRNLESIVSASGRVRAKRTVSITSEVNGKVTRVGVEEGDHVKAGQFLLDIDSRIQRTNVQRMEASVEQQKIGLQQAQVALESAKINLKLAQDDFNRQQGLWAAKLTTRQEYDRAENTLRVQEYSLKSAEQSIARTEQSIRQIRADLSNAEHDLSKVTITAPFAGVITRRNVEAGENAQVGYTNNPSVVMLTLADMSVIESEIEVDETDVPNVKVGQHTKVTIDALPDRTFKAHVTEVGNSPIATTTSSSRQATNFKVVVTVDEQIPEVRPGFTCTADITTATRTDSPAVPIQALTVRELVYDASGAIVRAPKAEPGKKARAAVVAAATPDLKPGQTRKETEGVFVVRDGKAEFVPVKTGIAGDKYFEILSGLKLRDQVITGPFASVRNLREGAAVTIDKAGLPDKK